MNKEIIKVWNFLQRNNVKYLTIGGLAVNLYGYGRNTGDIDIYIDDTIENRHNLGIALKNLGIGSIQNIETNDHLPDVRPLSYVHYFEPSFVIAV